MGTDRLDTLPEVKSHKLSCFFVYCITEDHVSLHIPFRMPVSYCQTNS